MSLRHTSAKLCASTRDAVTTNVKRCWSLVIVEYEATSEAQFECLFRQITHEDGTPEGSYASDANIHNFVPLLGHFGGGTGGGGGGTDKDGLSRTNCLSLASALAASPSWAPGFERQGQYLVESFFHLRHVAILLASPLGSLEMGSNFLKINIVADTQ